MDPLTLAGGAIGLIGGVANLIGTGKRNRQLNQLLAQDPAYKANPLVAQRLGLAQTLLNARMPGAASAERNIYQNQANTMANVNRNATDASQALALAASGQGQSNQAFSNLAGQEAQDYQRRYGNLVGAQDASVQEQDKVFQDQVRRYQDAAQIRGAQAQNSSSAWNSLSNLGFGAMSLGMMGGSSMLGLSGGNSTLPSAGPNDPTGYMSGRRLNMPILNSGYPNTSLMNR